MPNENSFILLTEDPLVVDLCRQYAVNSIRKLLTHEPTKEEWQTLLLVWGLGLGDGMLLSIENQEWSKQWYDKLGKE